MAHHDIRVTDARTMTEPAALHGDHDIMIPAGHTDTLMSESSVSPLSLAVCGECRRGVAVTRTLVSRARTLQVKYHDQYHVLGPRHVTPAPAAQRSVKG